ncbi:hypothetical protein V7S43_005592 [Phytophthora oleae]|uniref:C3H1-type domain-containing protein n=1 Tax=Phytophthora oleae TaxID=2107226 RepID=A0ABD3FSD2_9STRA
MSYLSEDSPEWWRNYSEAVRAIDYHAVDWQASLNGLVLRLAADRAAAVDQSSRCNGPPPASRRAPANRIPVMPEHIRRQIPRNTDGFEPCLRFLGGGMCYRGSAERCAHARSWDRRLPRDLQEFIDRHYGQARGGRSDRRQDNQ